jgi:hypothetical protein
MGGLIAALPATASAACTNPNGTAGDQIYNSTYSVMQYCNGTDWVNMGSTGGGSGVDDGDKGDITVSSSGAAWAIDSGAVTNTMLAGSIALSKLSITGTPNGSKFLRDDGSWQTPSASVSADSLDFDDFVDAMALDASTDILITGLNVLSITNGGSSNTLVVNDTTSDPSPFVIDSGGDVGIGSATPTSKLDVVGTVTATTFSGSGASLTSLNATNLSTGTVGTARLGSGTANSTTFLRGDGSWQTPSASVADGDKGDITVSSSGAAWAIDSGAVTNTMLAGSIALSKLSITGTPNGGKFLRDDGSWQTAGGSTSAAGSDTYVQFNDGGTAFGGDAGFTYNKTTDALTVAGALSSAALTSAAHTITSTSASALVAGANGGTNPVLKVDANTASVATGISITGAAAASRAALAVISSGTNEGLSIDAKGSGTIRLGATSTGAVEFSRAAVPTASDGATLGTGSLMWSDLFLASGSVINFNNGDVTLTHSSNTLTIAGGMFAGDGSGLTTLNADNISSGTVGTARLGSGTANNSTFLRGDGSWQTPSASVADGDKGDITVSSSGAAWAIDSGAVTNTMLAGSIALSKLSITGTPDGSKFLRDDGTWAAGGSTSAAGSDTYVQFNDGGTAFGGDAGFTYNKTTDALTVAGALSSAAHAITSTSASALVAGANGGTNPVLKVDASTGSVATGISITGAAAASRAAVTVISSGTNEGLSIDAKGSGTIRLGATSTGAVEFSRNAVPTASNGAALGTNSLMWSDLFLASGSVINFNNGDVTLTHSADTLTMGGGNLLLGTGGLGASTTTITSNWSSALAVGANGATNPVLKVDASASTVVTGISITGAANAGRAALAVISAGSNEGLSVDAKGSGTIRLGATSTGAVEFSRNAVPTASDGAALGTSSLMWADLFLASGSVINFNAGDVTLTHSANTLTIAGGNLAGSGSGLTSLNADNISSGTVGTARLGTGTANSTTFLRGDGSWQAPSASVADDSLNFDKFNDSLSLDASTSIAGTGTNALSITHTGSVAALKITNTGTGNSFLVEDDTSTDTTPFVIDASGKVGISTTTPVLALDVNTSSGGGGSYAKFGNTLPVYLTAAWPGVGFNANAVSGNWFFGAGSSSDYAGLIMFNPTDSGISFAQSTASGNAGGSITWNYPFVITPGGNVGIGTTIPDANVTVASSGNTIMSLINGANASEGWINRYTDRLLISSSNAIALGAGAQNNNQLWMTTSGFVGISNAVPDVLLHVGAAGVANANILRVQDANGNCVINPATSASQSWSCSSDERLKFGITDTAISALDYFSTFRVRDYRLKADGEKGPVYTGVIAQEVLKTHKDLVKKGEDGMYLVSEPGEWRIVKALQELKTFFDGLAAKVEKLVAQVMGHDTAIKELKVANENLRKELKAVNDNHNAEIQELKKELVRLKAAIKKKK